MRDSENDAKANLEFFRSAILEPALGHLRRREYFSVSMCGVIEAARWARLGAQIGYFDPKDAYELISSSWGVFEESFASQAQNSRAGDLERTIRQGESGPVLDKEVFYTEGYYTGVETTPHMRENLQNKLQTLLLLTADNLFDDSSLYFLECIGWTNDTEWKARREGTGGRAAQDIGLGFANTLDYWEQLDFWWAPEYQELLVFNAVPGDLVEDRQLWARLLATLHSESSLLLRPRFNLGKSVVVERYFTLAGEFASRAREDSPEWLDARIKVFEKLTSLITSIGGDVSTWDRRHELWRMFTKGTERSFYEDKTSPAENSPKSAEKKRQDLL
jgi:hypothetical protein